MRKRDELNSPAGCMARAHDDEMTFVLLARDAAAPVAIRAWIKERIRLGKNKKDDPQILEAEEVARVMDAERGRPMIWRCACGWVGRPDDMPANPSGSKVCPDCGASGGLVMHHPRRPGPFDGYLCPACGHRNTTTLPFEEDDDFACLDCHKSFRRLEGRPIPDWY